jgi:hypothetical protein
LRVSSHCNKMWPVVIRTSQNGQFYVSVFSITCRWMALVYPVLRQDIINCSFLLSSAVSFCQLADDFRFIISSFPSLLSIHGFLFLHSFCQVLRWISFSIDNLLSQSVSCRLICRLIPSNSRVAGDPYQTNSVSQVVY